MKTLKLLLLSTLVFLYSCSNEGSNKEPQTEREKVSYSLGVNFAETALGVIPKDSLDTEMLIQGLNDFFTEKDLYINAEECIPIIQEYIQKLSVAKQEAGAKQMNEWLNDTINAQDIQTIESGLQYQVIVNGDGSKPVATDQVSVHYYGTLKDGTKFDSSFDRGEPTTFPVSGVIPGWSEALQLMPVGSKWKLIIPSELAYGEKGAGAIIPPNSDLIFIVELISISN